MAASVAHGRRRPYSSPRRPASQVRRSPMRSPHASNLPASASRTVRDRRTQAPTRFGCNVATRMTMPWQSHHATSICEPHADGVHLSGTRQHEHAVDAVPAEQTLPSRPVRPSDLGACQHVAIASKVAPIHDATMPSHGSPETDRSRDRAEVVGPQVDDRAGDGAMERRPARRSTPMVRGGQRGRAPTPSVGTPAMHDLK